MSRMFVAVQLLCLLVAIQYNSAEDQEKVAEDIPNSNITVPMIDYAQEEGSGDSLLLVDEALYVDGGNEGNVSIKVGFKPVPTCQASWLPGKHMQVCDGFYDCRDRSDETGCDCPHTKFECDCYESGCSSRWGCIFKNWRCDKYADCGDSSDELDCHCSHTMFECRDGSCIDRSQVNDKVPDCAGADDEFSCDAPGYTQCGCADRDPHCTSTGRCIVSSWVGDMIADCHDGSDEPCNASKAWCEKCMVIINRCPSRESKDVIAANSYRGRTSCNRVTDPLHRNHFSHWICITSTCGKCLNMFQCENGQIIDSAQFCDAVFHCDDKTDEETHPFGFRCTSKSRGHSCVLPQKNVHDSIAQCADRSDLCFVDGEFRCFRCLDEKLIISAKQLCDGSVDCYDMSDECLCSDQTVCNAVLGDVTSRCHAGKMHCYDDDDCVDLDQVLCKGNVTCVDQRNLQFCHQEARSSTLIRCKIAEPTGMLSFVYARQCDHRPECGLLTDECQCKNKPSFCDGGCQKVFRGTFSGHRVCDGFINEPVLPYYCKIGRGYKQATKQQCKFLRRLFKKRRGFLARCARVVEQKASCPDRFYCRSKIQISIDKRSVCDGILDCDDHSDENSTTCLERRFYCTRGDAFSIDKTFVCDGLIDCDKGEDEAPDLCRGKRFYCENGEPTSVEKSFEGNGINDCSDGSDECSSLFSDRYEMIANPLLRALFWTMGLFALFGNIMVHVVTAKELFCHKNTNVIKQANDIFILNLTVSDFLMSVYLLGVVGQGYRYSGFYCFVDKQWRASKLCSGLSTLVIVSSQTTTFIMAAMSTLILIMVYKPFLARNIKLKWVAIAAVSCWFSSILLATIPWFGFDSGYFASEVWFPNVFWKTDTVSKSDMFELATRVSTNMSGPISWSKAKEIALGVFKYHHIKGEYGYYGETSVCMPHLFASTAKPGWQYSTFLVTLNFLILVYTVVAYVLVFKKSTGMERRRSNAQKASNKGLQQRIMRVLLTDCGCWIPICIMSYISLAGVHLPPDAYIVSAGFLLPINSAMNPILYSKFVGRKVSRCKMWIAQKLSASWSMVSQKISSSSLRRDKDFFMSSRDPHAATQVVTISYQENRSCV